MHSIVSSEVKGADHVPKLECCCAISDPDSRLIFQMLSEIKMPVRNILSESFVAYDSSAQWLSSRKN